MRAWPISTPRLNEKSDQPMACAGKPNSRSTVANPNRAVTRRTTLSGPEVAAFFAYHQVVSPDIHDAQSDGGFNDVLWRIDDIQRGQRKRNAVGDGKGGHDFQQPKKSPPINMSPMMKRMWSGPIKIWWTQAEQIS